MSAPKPNKKAVGQPMKHRQLAMEYGVRGYEPGGSRRLPKSRGERLAEQCCSKLVAHRDKDRFADPPVQRFQGSFGHNAAVFVQILSNNGERFEQMMRKVSQGGKAWGRIEKERLMARDRKDGDSAMQSLELHEHSLVVRTQMYGFWSDPYRSDVETVSADDVMELVREYNEVAPSWEDHTVALALMRKAERICNDAGLIAKTREVRKLKILTAINIASLYRRRATVSGMQAALRSCQTAELLVNSLGPPPAAGKGRESVSVHAICVLRLRCEALINLDENGMGGLSDPFLRISRAVTKQEHKSVSKALDKSGSVSVLASASNNSPKAKAASWKKAKEKVVLQQTLEKGKVVYRSEIVMNSLNPIFKRVRLGAPALCDCDLTRPIDISIFDWDSDGSHDLVGSLTTTFLELQQASREGTPIEIKHGTATAQRAGKALFETAKDAARDTQLRGLLHVTEAWVSNSEEQRLQLLRAETFLQRAAVKALQKQHKQALSCAERALDELLSDRACKRRTEPLAQEALRVMTTGKHIWHGLLLIVTFEVAATEAERMGRDDHVGMRHNAHELVGMLQKEYEQGRLKLTSAHGGRYLVCSETRCRRPFDGTCRAHRFSFMLLSGVD